MTQDNLGALRQWRRGVIALAKASGENMIGNTLPQFWCEELTFACSEGHVSYTYLNDDNMARCQECRAPVVTVPPVMRESNFAHFLEGPRYWTRVLDENGALALVIEIMSLRGDDPAPSMAPVLFEKGRALWPVMRGADQIAVLIITKFDDPRWPGMIVELKTPSV